MPIAATMDLDLRSLDKGLSGIKRAGKNLAPVWRRIRGRMKDDQLEHWEKQVGTDGAWEPRARSTRVRHGRKKKIFSKKFATGFSILATKFQIAAISKIPYAADHQFGGTVGHGTVLPARPFLYLSVEFQEMALIEIQRHLGKGWSKGR